MLRYHPDDPRSSMSGYEGSLTPAQQTALEELTSAVGDLDLGVVSGDYGPECLGGDHAIEPLRLVLLRFLRGNGFSVQKALSQLRECVEYRAKHPADQLLSKSPREVLGCDPDQYHSLYSHWFMGFDRLGRPMLVQQFRNLRTWEAVKMTTIERMAELHAREQELLLRALRRQTLESGDHQGGTTAGGDGERSHIVDSVVIVVDTGGLTLRHVTRDFVRLFKLRSFSDQLLFPEMMGKCIIVNTPSLFGYVWSMFSPMVDARTRAKIDVIPRPANYEAALREIADPDQISPEYGGTGPAHADRLSIADALQAAGSRGGFRIRAGRIATGAVGSSSAEPEGLVGVDADSVTVDSVRPQGSGDVDGDRGPREAPMAFDLEQRQEQEPASASRDYERDEPGDDARADWFSSTWSAFGGLWGKGTGVGGDQDAGLEPTMHGAGSIASVDEDEVRVDGRRRSSTGRLCCMRGFRFSRYMSMRVEERGLRSLIMSASGHGGTHVLRDIVDGSQSVHSEPVRDREFFDALSELDDVLVQRRDCQGEGAAEAKAQGREGQVVLGFRRGSAGDETTPSSPSGQAGVPRRRRSRLPAVDESEMDAVESADRGHDSAVVVPTRAVEWSEGGVGGGSCRKVVSSLGILGWCLKPAVARLSRCELEKLVRWLCIGNAGSALLAVASIVVGAWSVSTSWLGAVFGWQWTAIASVCFGCLLLLLSLVGTAGARFRNRFTLLGFAALEGAVAIGTILMGAWCFALASGSATISDLTWDTISEERNESMTKEEFLDEARGRLIALGVLGLVIPVYSVAGPCLLSLALSDKIRQLEGEAGTWRDGKKRFAQLQQWFQEVNVVLTAFAMVCTGYGGWALSFTISLGLAVGVTSTYLMLAGGYILLLAGAVSAWAARSGHSEAYRLHFWSLVPAGVLYAALTVVQLVRAQSSNSRIEAAWVDLYPEGEELSRVQARVKTMLIVGGIVSAMTFLLGIAALVASWATRRALLQLDENTIFANHGKTWRRLSRGEKGAIVWALALAVTSTFLDGSFAVFSAWLARESEQVLWLVEFWRAMGRGDKRYVEGDTFVVATAVVVAAVIGPGSLLYAWSVYCRRGFRFSVGILVCTASLYTQVLRYVTKAGGSSSSRGQGGTTVVFIVATVVLGLLQVVGALVVLLYNIRRMTMRVHAAEVQYRALLSENHNVESGDVDSRPGVRWCSEE